MASAYPGALDSFTNPTSTDNLNTTGVLHDVQHSDVNDAVVAVETELGVDPKGTFATVVARLDATPIKLAQVVVGTATATIDFPSIPAGYETLTLDVMGRSDLAATDAVNLLLRVNNDSSAVYDYEVIESNGASAPICGATQSGTSWRLGGFTGPGSVGGLPAGKASMAHVVLPNYARTVFHKMMVSTPALATASAITLDFTAGAWRNTAAINQLTLLLSGGNFVPGTVATLYATP